jgi:hypothetical protein
MTALKDAETLLMELRPGTTHDPETLGLWGAVHTRFWDLTTDPMHLDSAIAGYERGYILTQDFAPGIALAFLLDVRASYWMKQREKLEGIADAVRARRVRRDVAAACERALAKPASNEVRYSIIAALWEANAGLGDREAAAKWKAEVESSGVPGFMVEATSARVERLVSLLETSPLAS